MSDYPDMVTPTELRALADGLENQNHASEQMALLFKRALNLKPGEQPCDCISVFGGHYIQECDCRNTGDLSQAESWCQRANLASPPNTSDRGDDASS